MKIQCDVCERAEASVLCCADEAALCWACDERVHAANKLAGKHQRVPLISPTPHLPKCDICQEKAAYFFCLEDRALLCRQCDVSIHTASPFVRTHQRFLVTGVKVSLHQHQSQAAVAAQPSAAAASSSSPSLLTSSQQLEHCQYNHPHHADQRKSRPMIMPSSEGTKTVGGGGAADFLPHWPLDEILASGYDFNQSYEFPDLGSSRDSS